MEDGRLFHGFQITRAGLISRADGRLFGATVVVWVRAVNETAARTGAINHVESELARSFKATHPAAVEIEALGTVPDAPELPQLSPDLHRTGFVVFRDD